MTSTIPNDTSSTVAADDLAAITGLIQSLARSWALNDADALAQVYSENASVMLPGGVYLKGRAAIRDAMAASFEGRWKGTHVLGIPVEIRSVADDVCVVVSQGGAYRPGADEVSSDDAIQGLWVFARQGSDWAVTAYENSPAGRTIPVPDQGAAPAPDGNR